MNKKLAGIFAMMRSVADWMSGSEREQQGNYAAGYRMGKNSG